MGYVYLRLLRIKPLSLGAVLDIIRKLQGNKNGFLLSRVRQSVLIRESCFFEQRWRIREGYRDGSWANVMFICVFRLGINSKITE